MKILLILLGAFIVGWVGFYRWASRQKYSKTISLGGGFIVACLVFCAITFAMFPGMTWKPESAPVDQVTVQAQAIDPDFKVGMLFHISKLLPVACPAKEMFLEFFEDAKKHDYAHGKPIIPVDSGACVNMAGDNHIWKLDSVDGMTISFHEADNPQMPSLYSWTSIINPLDSAPVAQVTAQAKAIDPDFKLGMLFHVSPLLPIACPTKEMFLEFLGYAKKHDYAHGKLMIHGGGGSGVCIDMTGDTHIWKLDGVDGMTISFHAADNPQMPSFYSWMPIINPLDFAPIAEATAQANAIELDPKFKVGMLFHVSKLLPIACPTKEMFLEFLGYAKKHDYAHGNLMILGGGGSGACIDMTGDTHLWKLDGADGMTISFHAADNPQMPSFYSWTPIINLSEAPTPSAAN